jgi:hypothetical protein
MKKIFLFLIIIISTHFIYGQNTIKGKVTDKSGKSISGVLVKVFSKNGVEIQEHKPVYSSASGAFVLDIAGVVEKIQVEKKGFLLKEYTFGSQNKTLSIILIKKV